MRHVDVVALLGAIAWLLLIFELVRRRQFSEGYSLLWLFSGVVLLVLSLWRELLDLIAHAMGIFYPPTALFVIAVGFVLLLIVQQSAMICKMEKRNNDLAQRIALLALQVERLQERRGSSVPSAQDDVRGDTSAAPGA